jgi:hypothetical protein
MKVTRRSELSGRTYTLELPVTPEQLRRYERREDLLQNIFKDLSPADREFIKSGITQEEWEGVFGSDE